MVSRKPVPSRNDGPSAQPAGSNQLPYPITPTSPSIQQRNFSRENQVSDNPWSFDEPAKEEVPVTKQHTIWSDPSNLKTGGAGAGSEGRNRDDKIDLPTLLRVSKPRSTESVGQQPETISSEPAVSHQLTPKSSWETDRSSDVASSPVEAVEPSILGRAESHPMPNQFPPTALSNSQDRPVISTNPFHRAPSAERAPQVQWHSQNENSSNIWAELAANPTPSTAQPPLDQRFDKLKLVQEPSRPPPPVPEPHSHLSDHPGSPLISFDQGEEYRKELGHSPFGAVDESDPWKNESSPGKGKEKAKAIFLPPEAEENPFQEAAATVAAPPLPAPKPVPSPALERKIHVPEDVANRQRSETYPIKHIRWLDSSSREVRTSPILIQNKNGPCPLLALVNALTLSTTLNINTALIETLRVREQVSLGLLLDAVFDELMSGRRGDAAQELPDVGELYSFLITLHTGMNVNPRFLPAKRMEKNLVDETEHVVPLSIHDYRRPGTFEHTKEMLLYGTFSIPLMHGWIPPKSHPALQALERSAQTYEDAQNLLFREEELEDKLQRSGLSPDEQLMLEDIASIKYFLNSSATQLTGYGLDIIQEALKPGEIVILFRNDHFSTLYKNPKTGQLLHLVTDAGYSGHEEIVWESLVDVNGEGSEFFSGDFRPVGQTTSGPSQQQPFEQSRQDDSDWTTVTRKGQKTTSANNVSAQAAGNRPLPPPPEETEYNLPAKRSTVQEDADLALAMQLQEEEESQSRRSAAARQRENELSAAYLKSQNIPTNHINNRNPPSSNASSSNPRQQTRQTPNIRASPSPQTVRPLLPPRRDNPTSARPPVHREATEEDDDAPPSYEDASKSEPYHPQPMQPSGPAPPVQNPQLAYGTRPRVQSAYSSTSGRIADLSSTSSSQVPQVPVAGQRRRSGVPVHSTYQDPSMQGIMRRRSSGLTGSGEDRRDKDCVVM